MTILLPPNEYIEVMIPHLFLIPPLHLLIIRPHVTSVMSPKITICYMQPTRPLPVTQVSLFITVLHNRQPLVPVFIRLNRVYDLTPSLLRVVLILVGSSIYIQVSEVIFFFHIFVFKLSISVDFCLTVHHQLGKVIYRVSHSLLNPAFL